MKNRDRDKKSFVMYNDFADLFGLLSLEERGRLITAIFDYVRADAAPECLSAGTAMAFQCIKNTLDRDYAAYVAKCEKNAENAKKGGRPRKASAPEEGLVFSEKTERFFEKPKKSDNDNDNDSGTDNDSDNDNDIDSDSGTDSGTDGGTDNDKNVSAVAVSAGELSEQSSAAPPFKEDLNNNLLFLKGVPDAYISERRKRAEAYAAKKGRDLSSVLSEWWEKENAATKRRYGAVPVRQKELPPEGGSSFDVDEFFAAAVARSYGQT